MKKILVTGADGFIGSHLAELLVEKGYSVKAFVHYNSFNSWGWLDEIKPKIKKEIEVFSGDVRDLNGVNEAIKGCEMVMHLAALIGIPYSYHSPDTYIDTNIKGTLNILQASRNHDIQKIIHTSTSEVYGSAQYVPIDENHPLQGQSPYSASKIGADEMAKSFYLSFKTPVGIIRPFNTYGPRQSARAIIPTIISQVLSGNKNIKLGSLSPTRDFNYVSDTVNAYLCAIKSNDIIGEVVNLGNNYEISIGDLAKTLAKIMNQEIIVEQDDERLRPKKSEVERLCANNKKAIEILKWKPLFHGKMGLEEGLHITIEWFKVNKNLSKYKSDIFNI